MDQYEAKWRDLFPNGLKVLVVDDDQACLKFIEKLLLRCEYLVTSASSSKEALIKLKDEQHDIVLSDVHMPDIDGFELMAKIGLDMDTPVIMMSVDGDRDCVLKGVAHGAVDYLVKPIRIEEIQNIWQHVYRRRQQHKLESSMDDDREVQQGDYHKHKRNKLGCSSTSNGKPVNLDFPNYSHVNGGSEDKKSADGNTGFPDMEILEPCLKKQRIVWDKAMHRKFIDAVNQLGIEKAVPKKILEIMNISGLTRENVASHLQKYRLYLKRVEGVQVTTARPHKTHKGLKRDLSGEHAQQGSFQSAPNVLTSYQVGILPPACGAFMLPIDGSMLGPLDGAPAAVPTALNPALRSLSGESEAGKG